MQHANKGFSLIEVVISVVVLSIGVLGVLSAMTYSVSQQQHAEVVPAAALYAQRIMEAIHAQGALDATGTPKASLTSPAPIAIDAPPFDGAFGELKDSNGDNVEDSFLNLGRYQRTVTITRLSTNVNNYRSVLAQVTVTVYWSETSGVDSTVSGNSSLPGTGGKVAVTRSFSLQSVMR